jgi:hypothetical protein
VLLRGWWVGQRVVPFARANQRLERGDQRPDDPQRRRHPRHGRTRRQAPDNPLNHVDHVDRVARCAQADGGNGVGDSRWRRTSLQRLPPQRGLSKRPALLRPHHSSELLRLGLLGPLEDLLDRRGMPGMERQPRLLPQGSSHAMCLRRLHQGLAMRCRPRRRKAPLHDQEPPLPL